MASDKHLESRTKNKEQEQKYSPKTIEPKWQAKWLLEKVYQPQLDSAKLKASHELASKGKRARIAKSASNAPTRPTTGEPFFNLMMFPYPSAEGLHVGGIYTFGGVDVYGRFKRMMGYEVFEPIGLDGFGIHSENHAIKTKSHPVDHAKRTQENFYRQLHATGNGYAWDNKVETYNPEYYRWTQWIFVQLFKSGLAYRKNSPVNFCPSCMTVLSDEQVIDGHCERCDSVVEKKELEQWFFKITEYAERLLNNIEHLDWTDKVRIAQRNWIGKSEGALLTFRIENERMENGEIEVFTTAIDTVFGVTFMVISPEHPLVASILENTDDKANKSNIEAYIKEAKGKSEIERTAEGKTKTGVFSGIYVINPVNGDKVPLWIADYVLMGYGTGAVMGVPGHDGRDHAFAKKYKLDIKPVVRPISNTENAHVQKDGFWDYKEIKTLFKNESELFNSGDFNGLSSSDAKKKLVQLIAAKGYGKAEKTYHLRDWLISRQRYWGPPIPMIYCDDCAKKGKSWFTTEEARTKNQESRTYGNWKLKIENSAQEMRGWYPEEKLPVELPYVKDFKPMGTGKSPLANYPEFYETTCPECGGKARRETDVSDTFLDSAWYFLGYLATDLKELPFPMPAAKAQKFNDAKKDEIEKAEKRMAWLPVTSYIGGAEHSVLHLLYARFVTMALYDMGYVDFEEPFSTFYAHGLIIKDGSKMSKSKGNVINPDDYVGKYGADTLRTYLLFLGPFNQGGDFKDTGIEGMHRFIKRVWALFAEVRGETIAAEGEHRQGREGRVTDEGMRMMHETIKEMTEDLEELRFNTAISKLMIWYNFLSKQEKISKIELETYLQLFAPFAPHVTEELWYQLGNSFTIHKTAWPTYDEKYLVQDTVKIAVQVNGKLRAVVEIAASDKNDKALVEEKARAHPDVIKYIEHGTKKEIYIPGKILNFVV